MRDLQLLIVEDDLAHYHLMRGALEASGVTRMHHFVKGEALLEYLEQCARNEAAASSVFCILLDLKLPGISGVEVLTQLKARGDWARIPVIVLTNYSDPETISQCHRLGCSYFISKPLQAEAFQRTMSQLGLFVNQIELPSPFRKG
jgi:CheY-like chemotaxis protein